MENQLIQLTTKVNRSINFENGDEESIILPPPRKNTKKTITISRDEYSKSTQTLETAFVPCESCEGVQKCLREVGRLISSISDSQGITSTLAAHMEQVCYVTLSINCIFFTSISCYGEPTTSHLLYQ